MKMGPVQRQSLLTLLSLFSVTAIGYLSTIYFAHVLGPAIMGAYFTFLAYYGIFDLVADGGFGLAAVKRISEGKEQNEFFSAYVLLRCILLAVSLLAFILIFPFIPGLKDTDLMTWMLAGLVIGTVYNVITTDIYGTAQVGILQVSSFCNTTSKIVIQVIAVYIGFNTGGLVAGYVAGMIVAIILNFRFTRLSLTRFSRYHFKSLFSFSFWTFLSSGGALVFSYADTILIGIFLTQGDVGIYRLAFQLASVSSIIVTAFHASLFPRISQWHAERSLHLIESAISRAVTYCLILTIPLTIGGSLLARQLMYFLYGEAFQSGSDVLIILLFVQLANIFMFLFTMCLNTMNRPKDSFLVTSVSAVLNIVFNILLIPSLGIIGAACATLCTMSINAFLAYRILRQEIKPDLKTGTLIHILGSSAAMAFFVAAYMIMFGVNSVISLCIVIVLGALIYFTVLLKIDQNIKREVRNLMITLEVPYIQD